MGVVNNNQNMKSLLMFMLLLTSCVGLAFIIVPLLRQGSSVYSIQKAISGYGDIILAPALILIGLFMLFNDRINLPKFGFLASAESVKGGALLLGVLFAMAFCPTSGVFYFGMLMPMSAVEGYLLAVVFAVATALPVVVVAWILAYSVAGLGAFYQRMQLFQKWMNLVIALLFIAVGIYYIIILI